MNRFGRLGTPPTRWLLAFLLAALLAGCGGGGSGGSGSNTVAPGAAGTPGAAATDPTVGSASPGNGATNVPTSTNSAGNVVTGKTVTATFTQQMDPTTIESPSAGFLLTFTLKETVTGTNVPGTVAMNSAHTVATFQPTASALTPDTSYTATVTTTAKSALGTAMAKNVAWHFRTATVLLTGQAPVDLGTSGNYVILAKSAISTVPSSVVTGNMGLSPAAASFITGFSLSTPPTTFTTSAQVTGQVFASDYDPPTPSNLTTAVSDMMTAYTDAAGRAPDVTELGAGNVGGMTLAPGVYKWSTGLLIPTDVTLSGGASDVWIFQIAQDLTISSGAQVVLAGGALPRNIFWQTFGVANIGTTAHFEGILLSQTAINLDTGASANGRLLAQTAVTLDQNTVAQPAP